MTYRPLSRPDVCLAIIFLLTFISCNQSKSQHLNHRSYQKSIKNIIPVSPTIKCIHVFVALCDNKYQGIIPVPAAIGNGQDPENNLYWGGDYGVRTFFKRSKDWKLVEKQKMGDTLMERLIFKNISTNYYLVADAYNGKFIKQTTIDFLNSCAGRLKDTLHVAGKLIGIDGNAGLLAYIGHDGLMDFQLEPVFQNHDGKMRDCIVLACVSKKYFSPFLAQAKARPLVYTTGLMCPEAYTLHDAIASYIKNEPEEHIRLAAAVAYNKYQKSGLKFANQLLVSGP
jgi:hypothetical protein